MFFWYLVILVRNILTFCVTQAFFQRIFHTVCLHYWTNSHREKKWQIFMLQKYEVWIDFMLLSNPSGWHLFLQECPIYPCSYAAKNISDVKLPHFLIISFPAGSRWLIFHTIRANPWQLLEYGEITITAIWIILEMYSK